MSQDRGREANSGPGGQPEDILLVESDRVSQLPGMWGKRVTVSQDQIGFVMVKGAVVKELGSGTTRVGMAVLGMGGGKKEVLRFRFRPFPLRLSFGHVHGDGQRDTPAVQLTASIVTPSLLYNTALNGQGRLYASQLASVIIGAVEAAARENLTQPGGEGATGLDIPIRRALAERGIQVERLEAV